ncbi:unnamed protein product [Absidia cylindrospora]
MNFYAHLPCELISLILSHVNRKKHLYACALVNKLFYKETMPLLWHHLDIDSIRMHDIIKAALEASAGNYLGELVRCISIKQHISHYYEGRSYVSDDDLLALVKHVPLLTDLILEQADDITDASFEHVPLYVPHLAYLHLCDAKITQRSMEAMGRHWHCQLEQLELESCRNLDVDLFSPLAKCTALKKLTVSYCCLNGMNDDPDAAHVAALNTSALTNLTSLCIQDYPSDYTSFIIAAAAADVWPLLTHVCLDACHAMNDKMAITFIQQHPHLTHLELGNSQMTDKTLDAIVTYLPNIVEVGVEENTGITPDGLRRLVKQCRQLKQVACCGCSIYDDQFPDLDENAMTIESENGDEENRSQVYYLHGNAFDE